ncbi:unnamed protein product [Penicillium glandicola]
MTTASAYGESALYCAARNGHSKVCELLIQYDDTHKPGLLLRMAGICAQVKMKDFCNHTPLVYGVKEGHVNVVDVFLRSKVVSPNARNGYKELVFHKAVKAGNREVVQVFLDHGVPVDLEGYDGKRSLHLATDTGNLEMARLLLEHGASTKIKDSIGFTPYERSKKLG